MALPKETWQKAREMYENEKRSFRSIGLELGIDVSCVNRRARAERWEQHISTQALNSLQTLTMGSKFDDYVEVDYKSHFAAYEDPPEAEEVETANQPEKAPLVEDLDEGEIYTDDELEVDLPQEPRRVEKFLKDVQENPLTHSEKVTILDRAREVQMELFSTAVVAKNAIERFLAAHPKGKYVKSRGKFGIQYGLVSEALTPFAAILNATANITKEINFTINNNTQINNEIPAIAPSINIEFIGK